MSRVYRIRRYGSRLSTAEGALIWAAAIGVVAILAPLNLDPSAPLVPRGDPTPRAIAGAPPIRVSSTAIVGYADVRDGDGLRLAGQTIRLQGADAFELHQTCSTGACGRDARDALRRLTASRAVTCEPVDTDRYGRTVAVCSVEGADLGAQLVRDGHALAYRRYSLAYVDEEAAARAARAGAWAGTFQNPADWRRANPRR